MFASVWVKDYIIDLDGKPFIVKGERWIGLVNESGEPYFAGQVFDWVEVKQEYSCGGFTEKTKEEFEAEAERVTFFK